jgi:hypothetical protein
MIIIESNKAISNRPSNRISRKDGAKVKFHANSLLEHAPTETYNNLSVAPLLFLQEIDEYAESQGKLKESGNKILKCLNAIRLSLLSGTLKEQDILNLVNTLVDNNLQFKFPELQEVIDDIILRSEVELAKFEVNKLQRNLSRY